MQTEVDPDRLAHPETLFLSRCRGAAAECANEKLAEWRVPIAAAAVVALADWHPDSLYRD